MPLVNSRVRPFSLLVLMAIAVPISGNTQSAFSCIPPLRPAPVTDSAIRAEYAAEIREEYAVYFDAAHAFFRCIEDAQAAVTEEVNQAILDYGGVSEAPSN